MLSRRSLILGSGAAFITSPALAVPPALGRNRLAYPGGWARPGFDPYHIAVGKTYNDSGIAVAGQNTPLSLAYGGSTAGFSAAHVVPLMTVFGPAMDFSDLSNVVNSQLTVRAAAGPTPSSFTFGTILLFRGQTFSDPLIMTGYSGSAITQCLSYDNTGSHNLSLQFGPTGTNYIQSSLSMPNNVPCFIGASYNGAVANFIIANITPGGGIAGGAVVTQAVSSVKTIGSNVKTVFGGFGALGNNSDCWIAAIMYSENKYLTIPQLEQWAAAPWDFWYPPSQQNLLLSSAANSAGSGAPQRALTGVGQ